MSHFAREADAWANEAVPTLGFVKAEFCATKLSFFDLDEFRTADTDRSGELAWWEFVALWRKTMFVKKNKLSDADLQAVFNVADTNRGGTITRDEFMNMASALRAWRDAGGGKRADGSIAPVSVSAAVTESEPEPAVAPGPHVPTPPAAGPLADAKTKNSGNKAASVKGNSVRTRGVHYARALKAWSEVAAPQLGPTKAKFVASKLVHLGLDEVSPLSSEPQSSVECRTIMETYGHLSLRPSPLQVRSGGSCPLSSVEL